MTGINPGAPPSWRRAEIAEPGAIRLSVGLAECGDFFQSFRAGGGIRDNILVATAALVLWIGTSLLRIPFGRLAGILSGLQTQPAVLSYALQETGDEEPNIGYATVYPIALIGKIILAQVVLAVLQ